MANGFFRALLAAFISFTGSLKAGFSDYLGDTRGPKRFLPLLMGFVCTSGCTVGCAWFIVSSFALETDFVLLVGACVLLSALFVLACCFERYAVCCSVAVLALVFLLAVCGSGLVSSTRAVLSAVTGAYSEVITWISATEPNADADADCTLYLVAAVSVVALFVAIASIRGRARYLAISLIAVLIMPCLIFFSTAPDLAPSILLVASAALLLLSRAGCEPDGAMWGMRALKLLPAVALLAVVLAFVNPPDSFTRPEWPNAISKRLSEMYIRLTGAEPQTGNSGVVHPSEYLDYDFWEPATDHIDLAQAEPQGKNSTTVVQLKARTDGTMYLRGVSLARYSDSSWSALDDISYGALNNTEPYSQYAASSEICDASLRTRREEQLLYTPYYSAGLPESGSSVYDSYISNPLGLTEYTVEYTTSAPGAQAWMGDAYGEFVRRNYLGVPAGIVDDLRLIASEAGLDLIAPDSQPAAVSDYLAGVAVYDLEAPRMPVRQEFVLWFLQQSRRGYCVHFASAGALLLRTLGIPARFVTGFLTQSVSGEWVDVTDDQAHAWVEYYVDDVGWLMLECTPGSDAIASLNADPLLPSVTTSSSTSVSNTTVSSSAASANSSTTTQAGSGTASTAVHGTSTGDVSPADVLSGDGEEAERPVPVGIVLAVLMLLLAAAAIYLRRRLRDQNDLRMRAGGDKCAVALAVYSNIVRLSQHTKSEPPDELRDLALKAQFSRHELEQGELEQLTRYEQSLIDSLRSSRSRIRVFYDVYILLLY